MTKTRHMTAGAENAPARRGTNPQPTNRTGGRPRLNGAGKRGVVPKRPMPVDKYGMRIGSKRSRAAELYELGSTSVDVEIALGGAQLRVLNELAEMGHKVLREKVRGERGQRAITKYMLVYVKPE